MRRLLILLAASAIATPALAQHHGHHHPPPASAKKPAPKKPAAKKPAAKKPAAKKPAAKKPAAKKPAAKKPAAKKPAKPAATKPAVDPHAGHSMPAQADPHAGHQMPQQPEQADPHAGHQMPMPSGQPDPHAGHDMTTTAVDPPVAPPPPEAFTGPEHAADLNYGDTAMARSRRELYRMHGAIPAYRLLVDRLEARIRDGRDGYALDAEGWYGGDIDKLWLKAEADGELGGAFEGAELQALWSHAIGPFFDLQTGVRYDAHRGSDRGHLVLGVQGLAPYWIEIDTAAFLSDRGDVTARFEAEHDVRITQQLIVQPRGELDLALQDIPSERIGAGLSQIAIGARLRYQVSQLFAPYIGVEYERAFGHTRRFLRADGHDSSGWNLLAGLRFWF